MPRRLNGEVRKAINAKTVESAIVSEDVIFGRMNKHYGNGRVEVLIEDKRGAKKSVQAHIRKVLTKRSATPLTTSDVVGLTVREYESYADPEKRNYDIICILDRKSVSILEKEGKIPKWMSAIEGKYGSGAGVDVDEMFEFDYGISEKDDGKAAGGAGVSGATAVVKDSDEKSDDIDIDNI